MEHEQWKDIIASPDLSIKGAMKALSSTAHKILFVVDDDERLIGSVTDGDIRRAILHDSGFDKKVVDIMFKSPRYVMRTDKRMEAKVRKYLLDEKLNVIPIVDEAHRIVDVYVWHDFFKEHPVGLKKYEPLKNAVVIMAGGKGTRLDPFTKILPKPLIPFGEKPIIERIMDNFNQYGFKDFFLTLNYKKELIKTFFKEKRFPYKIHTVEEDAGLGTAGSLALLKNKIKDTFFVCNCDVFLETDLKNVLLWHKGEKALMTVIGCHKETEMPYGVLQVKDGQLQSIKEKPVVDIILNTGVYVLEPEVLRLIKRHEKIDMNHLIERVMQHGKVTTYLVYDGWHDLGEWKAYKETLQYFEKSFI